MTRMAIGCAMAVLASTAHAATPDLAAGIYAGTGQVGSSNGSENCASVGLTAGAPNDTVITYPGPGKTGTVLYVPAPTALQLCAGFKPIPLAGLDGFSSNASCSIHMSGGPMLSEPVHFAFTSVAANANSAVNTLKVTIPPNAPLGGGCIATIDMTLIRTGR